MTTITFDTLKYAERLENAGIPREHAKAEAEAVQTNKPQTVHKPIDQ